MHDADTDLLLRLEALLISLRDQVDTLTERVDAQLAQHHRALCRLEAEVAELHWQVREAGLDNPFPRGAPRPNA
ncbi:MAG: hypothetical protein AB1730_17385 [Myxococcota bacterium]|jgi:hypothetical protein